MISGPKLCHWLVVLAEVGDPAQQCGEDQRRRDGVGERAEHDGACSCRRRRRGRAASGASNRPAWLWSMHSGRGCDHPWEISWWEGKSDESRAQRVGERAGRAGRCVGACASVRAGAPRPASVAGGAEAGRGFGSRVQPRPAAPRDGGQVREGVHRGGVSSCTCHLVTSLPCSWSTR